MTKDQAIKQLRIYRGHIMNTVLRGFAEYEQSSIAKMRAMAELMGFELFRKDDPMTPRERIKHEMCRGARRHSPARNRAAVIMRELLNYERTVRCGGRTCNAVRVLFN